MIDTQPTTDTVPGKVQTKPHKPVKDDKMAVIAMLRAEGVKTKDIAQTLGIKPSTVYLADCYARRSGQNALLSTKRIKTATSAIDAFMKGEKVGDVQPKCSTVLSAAQVVLDRAYPKQVEQDKGAGVSFTQINISLAAPHIPDITPCQVTDI